MVTLSHVNGTPRWYQFCASRVCRGFYRDRSASRLTDKGTSPENSDFDEILYRCREEGKQTNLEIVSYDPKAILRGETTFQMYSVSKLFEISKNILYKMKESFMVKTPLVAVFWKNNLFQKLFKNLLLYGKMYG